MSMTPRVLGKGLEALLGNSDEAAGQTQQQNALSMVPLASLVPNPNQPRKHFATDALEELAASIRSQGIVQPLLVRPAGNAKYEIVAGERRWRAASLAGLTEIPVLVRQLSDMEVMAAALIENLQREDLNPMEEARALATLREQFGLSQDELANTLGKSRPSVANALRLLNLSSEAQDMLEKGHISAGHARAVLSLGSQVTQFELLRHCIQDRLSVRDAEYAAAFWKEKGVFPWMKVADGNSSAGQEQQFESQSAMSEQQEPQRRTKSPFLQNMQKQLRQNLCVRASISGSEMRGRISLSYQNQEELFVLLRRLGIEATVTAEEQKVLLVNDQRPDTA
ncbi:MAG: ParB/RepB/Spo0J family partition protein [Betaproteobacteria bacterium]|nr:ParB/RepB/Spo0J family partition protein [Betaproteobacteria bacterium]